jgi:hypothetical protein
MRVAVRPLLTGATLALGLTLGLLAPLAVPSVVQAQEVTPSVPPPGSLDVDVALLGDRASAGAVSVRVQCAQIAQFGTATYDRTEAVSTAAETTTVSFPTIPPGSDCNVTLPTNGSATGVTAVENGITTLTPLRIGPNERASLGGTITYAAARAGLAVTVRSTGTLAATRPATTATVSCADGTSATLTFPADGPTWQTQVVSGVRPGVSCTVTQPAITMPAGQVVVTTPSPSTATVTIPASGSVGTTIVNRYDNASATVTVTWDVVAAADPADEAASERDPVSIRLLCSSGTAGITDTTFEVPAPLEANGDVAAAAAPIGTAQVPAGATCAVVPVSTGARLITDVDPDVLIDVAMTLPSAATVASDGTTAFAITAAYSRVDPAPTLGTMTASITPTPVGVTDHGPVLAVLACGGRFAGATLIAGTAVGASLPNVPLSQGVDCAVTLPLNGALAGRAAPTTELPSTAADVTAAANLDVEYSHSTATVDPVMVLAGAAVGAKGTATLTVTCTPAPPAPAAFNVAQTAAGTFNLDPNVTGVAPGASCALTSTASGATATAIADTSWSPVTVTPGPGETARVTVTNTYTAPAGNVVVFHQIRGNATPYRGAVTITVVCNNSPAASGTLTSSVGSPRVPVVLPNLPVGTNCTVTQTAAGGVGGLTVSTAPPAAQTVTVTADPRTAVGRVTNTYTAQLGTVTVTKSVTGSGASLRGDVTVRVACTSRTGTFTLPAGATTPSVVTVDSLYPGETRTVSETANGAVEDVVEVDTVISPSPTVNIALGTRAAVTVTNEYTAVGAAATTTTVPGTATTAPTTTVAGGGGAGGGSGLPAAGSNVARVVWFAVAAISLGLAVQITRHRLLPHKR